MFGFENSVQEKIEQIFNSVRDAANSDANSNSDLGEIIEEFLDYVLIAILQNEL